MKTLSFGFLVLSFELLIFPQSGNFLNLKLNTQN